MARVRYTHLQRAERRANAARDVANGLHVAQVARLYNMRIQWVQEACRVHGVPVSPSMPRSNKKTMFFIIGRLIKGERQCDIARRYEVSRQYVSNIAHECRRAGIPLPGEELTDVLETESLPESRGKGSP